MSAHTSHMPTMIMSTYGSVPPYDPTHPFNTRYDSDESVPINHSSNMFTVNVSLPLSPDMESLFPDLPRRSDQEVSTGLHGHHLETNGSFVNPYSGSPLTHSDNAFSGSFEATQSLANALSQMRRPRAASHSRIIAPIPRRLSMRPAPNFDVAQFVPLPSSPQPDAARRRAAFLAYYGLQDEEEEVVDNFNPVLDNSVDASAWDTVDYDEEDASIAQAQTAYISHASFTTLPSATEYSFREGLSMYAPASNAEGSFLSDFNDLGAPHSSSPQPPLLATASPHTFLGTPPPAFTSAESPNRVLMTPQPRQYQWGILPDSGRSQFTPSKSEVSPFEHIKKPAHDSEEESPRPRARVPLAPIQPLPKDEGSEGDHHGRISIFNFRSTSPTPAPKMSRPARASPNNDTSLKEAIAELHANPMGGLLCPSSPVAVPQAPESPASSSNETSHGSLFGDIWKPGHFFLPVPSNSSAYNLPKLHSHLPLSMDNSKCAAYSVGNTLPPMRNPSPYSPSDPEDQKLPSFGDIFGRMRQEPAESSTPGSSYSTLSKDSSGSLTEEEEFDEYATLVGYEADEEDNDD